MTETFSLNLWFNDKASGKQIQAKFDLGSAALVLGLWESIRAFMKKALSIVRWTGTPCSTL